jgi:hypothetical protein
MKKYLLVFILTSLHLTSCSSESPGQGPLIRYIGYAPDPILPTGASGSFIGQELVFSAYSSSASRFAVIDPDALKVNWSHELDQSYDVAVPIGSFEGGALIGQNRIKILEEAGGRDFSIEGFSGTRFWNYSQPAAAFAFDIESEVKIVRYLGLGAWSESTITKKKSNKVAPVWKEDGTAVVLFYPIDGSYEVFKASSASAVLSENHECIRGDVHSSAPYTSFAFDEDDEQLLFSNTEGKVFRADVLSDTGCSPLNSLATLDLGDASSVIRISKIDDNTYGAMMASGKVRFLTSDATGLAVNSLVIDVCDFPYSVSKAGGEYYAVVCLEKATQDTATSALSFSGMSYVLVSKTDGSEIKSSTIDDSNYETFSYDSKNARLHALKKGGFGDLVSWDLQTGTVNITEGMFLRGIF